MPHTSATRTRDNHPLGAPPQTTALRRGRFQRVTGSKSQARSAGRQSHPSPPPHVTLLQPASHPRPTCAPWSRVPKRRPDPGTPLSTLPKSSAFASRRTDLRQASHNPDYVSSCPSSTRHLDCYVSWCPAQGKTTARTSSSSTSGLRHRQCPVQLVIVQQRKWKQGCGSC